MAAPETSRVALIGLLLVALAAPACGPAAEDAASRRLTIYSGRNEKLIAGLLKQFRLASGIEVDVRYASTSELAATIMEEGPRSPADVFVSQDAAALGALSRAGLLRPLPPEVLDRVPRRFRSPDSDWVGLSGRARVVVYNVDRVRPDDLPRSLIQAAEPRYRGRFGVAPNNASFQAHMAAYMAQNGEAALRELLDGLAANKPRIYPKNAPIVDAVIAGEIDWGLVNHYYLLRALEQDPDAPAKNFAMPARDGSDFINIAGAGMLRDSPAAIELMRFLVSDVAQRYFAQKTFEYPVVPDGAAGAESGLAAGLDYGAIADALDVALRQIQESGLSRFQ